MPDLNIIDTLNLPAEPWKNGGGTTREIAQAGGPDGFAWRLSIAEVSREGSFSHFPGMSRILTVIEGDGLKLVSPAKAHDVPPYTPFAFSGDINMRSVLPAGPIRDFNVIFDPQRIKADVCVITGQTDNGIGPGNAGVCAVYALSGPCQCDGIMMKEGNCALFENKSVQVALPDHSKALCVQLLACAKKNHRVG